MSVRIDMPLVGFRGWSVNERGELRSVNSSRLEGGNRVGFALWPQGIMRAECMYAGPRPLHYGCRCGCGLHAWYSLDRCGFAVDGAVIAGGALMECETGFRADAMRVIALAEPIGSRGRSRASGGWRDVEAAAERYDVPVLPDSELVAYAAWFGEIGPTTVGEDVHA